MTNTAPGGRNGGPALDRSEVMKRFGAPRRAVPRRPGASSARFIDRATSLPNRIALMNELEFALTQHPHHVAVVIVHVDQVPELAGDQDADSVARLVAAAARLRKAVRPSDMVGRIGPAQLAAALWGLETPEPARIVHDRVRSMFAEPLSITGTGVPVSVVTAIGVVEPMSTAGDVVGAAWAALESARGRRPRSA